MRSVYRFVKNDLLYGTLLYPYAAAKHRALVKSAARSQSHTYTCFKRSPGQLDALVGPVLERIMAGRAPDPLKINVFASSSGAEPYTLASTLTSRFPKLDFQITASDLHQHMVDHARAGLYNAEDATRGTISPRFLSDTFVKEGDAFRIRPELRARVTFRQASLLDPDLGQQFEQADLVFAQNVFCHLNEAMTRTAFANVAQFLKPRSALFIDGMNLDLREELTAAMGLQPLDYKIREIHEYARLHISSRWWTSYYGMEPYAFWRMNRARRYGTIFFKETH